MSSSPKQPVVLRIHKNDVLVGVKQFVDSQIVIGRQADVQLSLEGENLSVIHCALDEREGQWHLADLGSETGTRRNGETILDTVVESGDVIEIGDYRIEFFIGVPKPKSAPIGGSPKPIETPKVVAPPEPTPAPVAAPVQKPAIAPTPVVPPVIVPPVIVAPVIVTPVAVTAAAAAATLSRPVDRPTVDIISGNLQTAAARPMRVPSKTNDRKKKKIRKTFAPPSRYTNVKEFVKPTKGSVVEVMVAWRERVIATYSFSEKKTITIGSLPSCDVPVPIMGARLRKAPIVKVDQPAIVYILPEANGEVVRGQTSQPFAELSRLGRITRSGEASTIALEQGELIKMDVGDGISIVIRYVGEAPKPLMAPFLDLTTSELTGVVLAMALVAVLTLYMYLKVPDKLIAPEGALDEPLRTAVMIVKPTPVPPLPPPVPVAVAPEPPKPQPTPPPVVVKSTPSPVKQVVKPKERQAVSVVAKKDPGVSANAAPTKNKTGPRTQTSVKHGGSVKTTDSKASQIQSKSKDASKAGIFSTFGGGGANNRLAGQTSGSGELAGMSANSTGKSGMNENRPGEGLGSTVKDTGVGGNGKALEGIAGGISTQGRGGGNSGYGTAGLGGRIGVKVIPGGEGEAFSGTIDKEAIRRVIRANERIIRTCYERELNRTPDLVGKLTIEFDIGEKGVVLRAAVKVNELGNRAVADCLTSRLKTWRFPEPPTNEVVTVAYPFAFSN
ncbi:hypothetical protein BH10BDE1_BH10BDE1_24980 [soil metagenome]